MADEEIKIKIKADSGGTLERTRKRIEEIKSAMLETENVDTFNKLALEAGALETEIRRTEDAVTSLSQSGSELTKMSTALGRVGGSLASLDFEQAAEEAGRLAALSKSMTFGSAISSVKKLGQTFVTMGKALLTNPFFLMVGVVTLIVVAIVKLMDEIGLLKVVMDGLGAAFEIMMTPINALIEGLKMLTDYLGITDNAGEEYAENEIARNDKLLESNKKLIDDSVSAIDHEIAMRKARGEDTQELERERLLILQDAAEEELRIAEETALNLITLHGEDSEEYKEQLKAVEQLRDARKGAIRDVELFDAQTTEREKQRRAKETKKAVDMLMKSIADKEKADKEARDVYLKDKEDEEARVKKMEEDTDKFLLGLKRNKRDLEIADIKDSIEREKQASLEKLKRAEEDIDFTKMSAEAKVKWDEWYQSEKVRIDNESKESEKTRQKEQDKKLLQLKYDYDSYIKTTEELEDQDALEKEEKDIEKLRNFLENKIITQEEFDELEKERKEETQKELADIAAKYTKLELDAKIDAIDQEGQKREEYINKARNMANSIFELTNNLGKKDVENEEKRAKRQFIIKKGLDLASAINSASSAIPAYLAKNPLSIGGIPNPGAIFGFAQLIATNATAIASIASSKFESANLDTPSPTAGGGGSVNSGQQQEETPQMFFDNDGTDQNAGGSMNRNVVTVVDYTDIEEKGKEVNKLQQRVQLV